MRSDPSSRIRGAGVATVGVVGTGHISGAYLQLLAASPLVRLKSCAARSVVSARPTAERFSLQPVTLSELLADDDVDVVVNLTGIAQHDAVSRAVLEAGKHLYSEKPLASSHRAAVDLMGVANHLGLRVGCAPDTLLGAAHQSAFAAVQDGEIGAILAASAFFGLRQVRGFSADLGAYFALGGPLVDRGPYHLAQLIWILGSVSAVSAEALAVDTHGSSTPSTVSALLRFTSSAVATLTLSVDVVRHGQAALEIYGTDGSLRLPDPNFFGGAAQISTAERDWQPLPVNGRPFGRDNFDIPIGTFANYRGAGVLDLVAAIRDDRPHRASAELAAHVVEVIEAISAATDTASTVDVMSRCERPELVGTELSWGSGWV